MIRKSAALRKIPVYLISFLIVINAILKITGLHPFITHLREIGYGNVVTFLGGAIAVEIPFGMFAPPAIALTLIWISAVVRDRSLFITRNQH
ncbi:MAG: hypothetical protein H7Y31_15185 [Chitinophagaceae bacterium]|nr:hypothetical protein [Chitinophagaceae bacterium]